MNTTLSNHSITCCYDCKKRHIGCHGKCERYQAEHKALDTFNKQLRENKRIEQFAKHSKPLRRRT